MHHMLLKELKENATSGHPVTVAERELLSFVESAVNLLGSEQKKVLAEIWLDELAAMDRMPEPTSSDWQLVSLAASARLAKQLICPGGDRAFVLERRRTESV